jgi:hypothetical protein
MSRAGASTLAPSLRGRGRGSRRSYAITATAMVTCQLVQIIPPSKASARSDCWTITLSASTAACATWSLSEPP